jgi:AcrR family transcriptional regulator
MSPRTYRMDRRAAAVKRTRDRIVAAAVKLHAAGGVRATTWDDVAAAARVDRATVYRHFPSLAELVPACARTAFEAIDIPSRAELEAGFADIGDVQGRLERVIRESCACYERGAGWLRAAHREADLIPELARVNRRIQAGVRALVGVALEGERLTAPARLTLTTLIGYPFWQNLVDAGVPPKDAPAIITALATNVVETRRKR